MTGLSPERGLDAYDSGSEDETFAMSSPSTEQSKLDFSRTPHPTPVNNNNFSFGIN